MTYTELTKGQEEALKVAVKRYKDHEKYTVISGFAGTGKAQPYDTLIPTPNGLTMLCDLKVGDYVFDRHGKPTKVLGIYNQGKLENYKVTLSDGRVTYCNDEHLWTYYDGHGVMRTKTLKELMLNGLYYDQFRIYKYKIPVAETIEYSTKKFEIDPYVVGAFLGDGCCLEKQLTISSEDEEIVQEIARLINARKVKKNSEHNYSWTFVAKEQTYYEHKNIYTQDIFKELPSVVQKSYDKCIPNQYLYGDANQRLSLIQGLFDTDGSISKSDGRYNIRFTTCSHQLALDVKTVLLSLGYVSSLHIDKRDDKYTNNYCYSVNVNIPNSEKYKLFRLSRKKSLAEEARCCNKHRVYDRTSIINIEKMNERVDMICIYVDNPEHLYLTNDYIVTHNTTLVKYIIDELHLTEEQVVYVAYTGRASLVLRNKGCKNAITAHKLLYHAKEKPDGSFEFKPKACLDGFYKLIIVDEASMLPEDMWNLLLSHRVHVIALGDPMQLPPVEGDSNILDNPHAMLTEVVRQALDNPIIRLSMDIRNGKWIEYGGPKECRIMSAEQVSDRLLLGADQVICGKNITRHCLNERMRRLKWGDKYTDAPIEGDKCLCLKNAWEKVGTNDESLVNGMLGTISNIRLEDSAFFKPRMTADFTSDNGGFYAGLHMDYKIFKDKETTVNKDNWMKYPKNIRPYEFDFGDCITVHKSQGSEWEKVIVYDEWLGDKNYHQRWLYTGVTRSSKMLVVVK